MGVGDVSLPLCDAVIRALHEAVDDQAKASTFHGYMPEVGAPFLRKAIAGYYAGMGANVAANEIFISSGACAMIWVIFWNCLTRIIPLWSSNRPIRSM